MKKNNNKRTPLPTKRIHEIMAYKILVKKINYKKLLLFRMIEERSDVNKS